MRRQMLVIGDHGAALADGDLVGRIERERWPGRRTCPRGGRGAWFPGRRSNPRSARDRASGRARSRRRRRRGCPSCGRSSRALVLRPDRRGDGLQRWERRFQGQRRRRRARRRFWRMGLTVVGKPAATVIISSPGRRRRSPSSGEVKALAATRLAKEPELTRERDLRWKQSARPDSNSLGESSGGEPEIQDGVDGVGQFVGVEHPAAVADRALAGDKRAGAKGLAVILGNQIGGFPAATAATTASGTSLIEVDALLFRRPAAVSGPACGSRRCIRRGCR